MRETASGPLLDLRAIGGLHVVTLAWSFGDNQLNKQKAKGLLGFAIERTEFSKTGQPVEKYFIRGTKRFQHKDEGLPPGSPVPTSEHPIQTFQWGDYTVKPGVTYEYRVVPVYGEPKLLQLDDAAATAVEITTEREEGKGVSGQVRHDIYFNRGVAGSQAYARKFPSATPDENEPESDQMKWLSRGLFEALTGFIRRAASGDAADYKLRAMLYEFRYGPVGAAFKDAAKAGADVDIRYEAQSYKDENEAMIAKKAIKKITTPQKSRGGIRHNKFIVLIRKDKPVAVWTGSTNISAGGIFGHSNVGHIVWDRAIAQTYLDYWNKLADPNVATATLKTFAQQVEPTPARHTPPPADSVLTLFSPRDTDQPQKTTPTLQWYADLLASAKKIACMTFAFNFDPVFQKAVDGETDALSYLVFDKSFTEERQTAVEQNRNTIIAIGGKLADGDLENFIGENLTGFNKNRYIHNKFLLVDPLSDNPIVVTGTANFSDPSQAANDENMLVIRGNTRVADIYFGEFMRIFDHHYTRYLVEKLKKLDVHDPSAGYLKEAVEDWLPSHFAAGPKRKRRLNFMS